MEIVFVGQPLNSDSDNFRCGLIYRLRQLLLHLFTDIPIATVQNWLCGLQRLET